MIAWLAEQEWCDGNVGMFGTSYSGFNSLQIAAERPPALKAIVADLLQRRPLDRRRALARQRAAAGRPGRLLPLHDADVRAAARAGGVAGQRGQSWRAEWRRRWETNEPWLLTWLRENRDGPYWQAGSLRPLVGGYDRIQCPTMIVAGWADGYRNNTFRTVEGLGAAGTPWRLLAGPWAHADPATAIPGPRIDLDHEMVAWWDRWLRGTAADEWTDRADVFVRTSTVPEPDLELHEGYWVSGPWPVAAPASRRTTSTGPRSLAVEPDVGTVGLDRLRRPPAVGAVRRPARRRRALADLGVGRRRPDASSGSRVVRLRLSASAPAASLSVKLCDVFPDGTSALITRGSLDLAFRDGVLAGAAGAGRGVRRHAAARRLRLPARPGPPAPALGGRRGLAEHHRPARAGDADRALRLGRAAALARLRRRAARVRPRRRLTPPRTRPTSPGRSPATCCGAPPPARSAASRPTTCRTTAPHWRTTGARSAWTAAPSPSGRRPRRRTASPGPSVEVRVVSTLRVDIGPDGYDVVIEADAFDDEEQVGHREWREHLPR